MFQIFWFFNILYYTDYTYLPLKHVSMKNNFYCTICTYYINAIIFGTVRTLTWAIKRGEREIKTENTILCDHDLTSNRTLS